MVKGFETFKEAFKGYEDCYTIIGGTACDILMEEAALNFRLTKDIDMIVLIEDKFEEFAKVFWRFIKEGGYRCGWKNSEQVHFYRFTEPKNLDYPIMIELFSRDPKYQLHNENTLIIPIHVSEDISSLSAIMLNDEYYNFMMQGRKIINGVNILDAEHLIPFKIRAWVDLNERKQQGEHVNSRDLTKHKNDVFRLFRLVEPETKVTTTVEVQRDIEKFLNAMPSENINMKNLGFDISLEEVLDVLKYKYL